MDGSARYEEGFLASETVKLFTEKLGGARSKTDSLYRQVSVLAREVGPRNFFQTQSARIKLDN